MDGLTIDTDRQCRKLAIASKQATFFSVLYPPVNMAALHRCLDITSRHPMLWSATSVYLQIGNRTTRTKTKINTTDGNKEE